MTVSLLRKLFITSTLHILYHNFEQREENDADAFEDFGELEAKNAHWFPTGLSFIVSFVK